MRWWLPVLSCAVLSMAFSIASARAGVWSVDSLSPVSSTGAFLNADSCPSGTFCASVGSSNSTTSFSEIHDQGAWTTTDAPFQTFGEHPGAISCSSSTFCMAVGSTAAMWNGTVWSAVSGGGASSDLTSVSCAGTDCVAIGTAGTRDTPVALLWRDGVLSRIAPLAGDIEFPERVYCQGALRCVAFGDNPCPSCRTQRSFVASWSSAAPARWKRLRSPTSAALAFDGLISCRSLSSCTGVSGVLKIPKHLDPTKPIPETDVLTHWNGRSWHRLVGIPTHGYASISCPSSTSCEVVGFDPRPGNRFVAIAGHWDGHFWRSEAVPSVGSSTSFRSVSCASTSQCIAVGIAYSESGTTPLAESWRPG
jgi:hypothetical protein